MRWPAPGCWSATPPRASRRISSPESSHERIGADAAGGSRRGRGRRQGFGAGAARGACSADPVSGRRDRIVISAVAGLAEKLVSGEVEGEDTLLDKADGRVIAGPVAGVLDAADLAALHGLVRRVEDHLAGPQDI